MATFSLAFQKMIKWEGLYEITNIKEDAGGYTSAGISRVIFPDWGGWKRIDQLVKEGKSNSEIMHDKEVQDNVFKFWENMYKNYKMDQINSQKVSNQIFQAQVNCGKFNPSKWCQTIVGTKPDGVIGPITIAAINKFDENVFTPKFCDMQIAYYEDIVKRKPNQAKFLNGWRNRSLDFK